MENFLENHQTRNPSPVLAADRHSATTAAAKSLIVQGVKCRLIRQRGYPVIYRRGPRTTRRQDAAEGCPHFILKERPRRPASQTTALLPPPPPQQQRQQQQQQGVAAEISTECSCIQQFAIIATTNDNRNFLERRTRIIVRTLR